MRKIFSILLIILILSGVYFFYTLAKNAFSKDLVRLEILGPQEIEFGEETEYIVKIKNNSKFRLEEPELLFESPTFSIDPQTGKFFKNQTLSKEKIGEALYPGEEKLFSFKMKILGAENEIKTLKAHLFYKPKNLKAKYESATTYTTRIKSLPLTFDFDLPNKTANQKEFTFYLNYFSNLEYPLTDLKIDVEYPLTFEFIKSNPETQFNEWKIPLLNKSQGGRIEIKGKFSDKIGQAQIFRARLGIYKDGEYLLLKKVERGTEISSLSIDIRQEINKNPQYVAKPGDWLHYEVYFKNIGEEDLTNLNLISKLDSELFDFQTIKSDLGEFHSGDNTIFFDWHKISDLQFLPPMKEGKVEFWVKIKDDLGNVKEPAIKNTIFIGEMEEEFLVKLKSTVEIIAKGFYQDEIFGNNGPQPPVVGAKTSYTIIWQAKSYYSDIKNVKVKATLPPECNLTGKIFPEEMTKQFSFDNNSREIVWSIDFLKRTGTSGEAPNIAFQIEFLPQEAQRGKTFNIISETKMTGEDVWTGNTIEATSSAINTGLLNDASANNGPVQ